MQNILVFRFANRFIEPVLRAAHVDEIQITVAETLGVEGRSRYYDGIGALRDMIQNHLIQMMTFSTMEPPALWDAEMIRDHKVEVLKAVRAVDPDGRRGARPVHRRTRRREAASSGTAPSRASIRPRAPRRSPRSGSTSTRGGGKASRCSLRSGKRLAAKAHEVAFRFREPPTRLFRHTPLEHAEPNWLVFRMSPNECTELVVRTKQPGLELEARESVLARRTYTDSDSDNEASAYEGLLLDVLEGDHTPFLRFDEVEWSWRIVDPVLKAWETGAPEDYVAGQRRPRRSAPLPRPRPRVAAAGAARRSRVARVSGRREVRAGRGECRADDAGVVAELRDADRASRIEPVEELARRA